MAGRPKRRAKLHGNPAAVHRHLHVRTNPRSSLNTLDALLVNPGPSKLASLRRMKEIQRQHGGATRGYYLQVLDEVRAGTIAPSAVVGGGYRDARKVAIQWLESEARSPGAVDRAVASMIRGNPVSDDVRDRILGSARGSYQEDVVRGGRNWSGSDLKGKAKSYSGKYAKSRSALLAAIRKSLPPGWEAKVEAINKHGKLGLVIYDPEGARHEW